MLTGACISRAGLNRTTGLATLTLIIAAELPDADALLYLGGSVFGFAHHRGFTHTLAGAPVMAAGTMALVYGANRLRLRAGRRTVLPPRWGLLYLYALLGSLSHILLDLTNNYGVRPFSPFYPRWYSWDIIFIVEPLILAALLAGLALPPLFTLVQEEIGARRPRFPGRGGAIFALLALVLVAGFRDFQHRRAIAALESWQYQGAEPFRVSAFPYPTDPFVWHGVVETEQFFECVRINSRTGEVDPEGRAQVRYKPEETPVTLAAKKSLLGRIYLDWAAYPILEVEPRPGENSGYTVRFYDLRYFYPEQRRRPLSGFVQLDKGLNVVDQQMSFPLRRR